MKAPAKTPSETQKPKCGDAGRSTPMWSCVGGHSDQPSLARMPTPADLAPVVPAHGVKNADQPFLLRRCLVSSESAARSLVSCKPTNRTQGAGGWSSRKVSKDVTALGLKDMKDTPCFVSVDLYVTPCIAPRGGRIGGLVEVRRPLYMSPSKHAQLAAAARTLFEGKTNGSSGKVRG